MKDNGKKKDQLIQEVENLRRRTAELEKSESERKKVEEALQQSEDKFRLAFQTSPDAININRLEDGRYVDINQGFMDQTGFTREEVIGRTTLEINIWHDRADRERLVQGLLERGYYENLEAQFRRKDGSLGTGLMSARLLMLGEIPHVISITKDISERKRVEQTLLESEERFRSLVENAPDAIFIQTQGQFAYVNKAAVELFGKISPDQLLGQPVMNRLHPDYHEAVRERLRLLNEERKEVTRLEQKYLKLDGTSFDVEVSAVPFLYENQKGALFFFRDISERKRMDEERIILSKLDSMGILAGGIAHDFNNLLSVILGNLEISRLNAQNAEEVTPYLGAAQKAALVARDLANQLITFSKGGEPIKKLITLSDLLGEQVIFSLRGSPVECNLTIPSDLWLTEVDESQIGQVVRNIVLNAREAMPDGGLVSVKAENVELREASDLSLPAGNYVKVSITDQGGGIPGEILPKIFDPYFSTKQRGDQKGMGLGLTICHSVIQKHGGSITADSKTSKGTTIQIYLPALRNGKEEEPVVPAVSTGSGRILVMDDVEMIRNLVGEILPRLGYEVELVEDGEKALESYRQAKAHGQSFDAVILDLTVRGGMGGKETIQELIKIDPLVKAIVLSGYYNDPVVQNYEQYGFMGALSKPFLINDLSEILSRIIGSDDIPKVK